MKKLIISVLALTLSITGFAQSKLKGNKNVTIQSREVGSFNKIIIRDDLEVMLSQGTDASVKVETDENLQDAIFADTKDNILEVHLSKEISRSKALKVHIKVPRDSVFEIQTLDKAKVEGTGELVFNSFSADLKNRSEVELNLNAQVVDIKVIDKSDANIIITNNDRMVYQSGGNASVKLNIGSDLLDITTNDSSKLKVMGICSQMKLLASGKSDFKGEELLVESVEVDASGNTDVAINAGKNLIISAKNDTEIDIYGNPTYEVKEFTNKASLNKKESSK